jgi:formylglycine-generating enzyme
MRASLIVLLLLGCEGESVEGAKPTNDTGSDDVALADTSPTDTGLRGPAPISFKTSKGTFAIDATEVSNAQYKEFSDAKEKPPAPAFCKWKTNYAVENPLPDAKDLPVVNVDWCDAYQYCAWAGKRLCGGLAGDHVVRAGTTLDKWVEDSQWTLACQNNAGTKFSTGSTFPGGATGVCNITNNAGKMWSVTAGTECKGVVAPFSSIVNLTGNAGEWEDNCTNFDESGAASVVCFVRGGSASPGPVNDFDYECLKPEIIHPRNKVSPRIGFRCCSK